MKRFKSRSISTGWLTVICIVAAALFLLFVFVWFDDIKATRAVGSAGTLITQVDHKPTH